VEQVIWAKVNEMEKQGVEFFEQVLAMLDSKEVYVQPDVLLLEWLKESY